jgi:glutamate/tyrosine decarboxylase-like PLP-dependent enzyme
VPSGPVTRDHSPSTVRAALDTLAPLPEEGTAAGPLLEQSAQALFAHSLFNQHPRFLGYITAPPAPIGILADLLASALNPNVGAWALSPAATEVERQVIRWLASFIRFPTDCGGILVSGGNMANLVCWWAARAAKAPWSIRQNGVKGGSGVLRAYCSAETHTWIQKAADLSGLGTASVRWITTDDQQRMDVEELRARIDADAKAGDIPFMVVGNAGTVSTGAIDPLRAIQGVCRERGLWFHVDGAYGAVANALHDAPDDLRAIELADSVAVDPHKWLYAPLEVGCALVKDSEALSGAFSYRPAYYHFGEHVTNLFDYGPQNSRGFRALKVWMAFKHVGAKAYRAMIAEDIEVAHALRDAVVARPDQELLTCHLSVVTFRYVPTEVRDCVGDPEVEQRLEAINRRILDRIQQGGEAFVSHAVVNGRVALRACVVNFRTSPEDARAVVEIVARIGRAVVEEEASSVAACVSSRAVTAAARQGSRTRTSPAGGTRDDR